MKTPPSLQALIDDGVIDRVIRPLKSGKEASVYVVEAGQTQYPLEILRDTGLLLCGAWAAWRPRSPFAVDNWLFAPVAELADDTDPTIADDREPAR